MWSALGKYKSIVVSIALFLLLDASVLMLNFYISFKISDDAVGVNLAGRQRMLSQRMVKSLYEFDSAQTDSAAQQKAREELALSTTLFNRTLTAFDIGGTTKGADGSEVILKPVTSDSGRAAIEKAKRIWAPYYSAIQSALNNETSSQTSITTAIALAEQHNLMLLKLMNQLTVDLEHVATSKATTLRYIQTAGISLAIINFLIILFHFIGELKTNDKKLEAARKETTDILDTVSEGLFLVDKDLQIGDQYSACLPAMFGRTSLQGMTFTDLIQERVKPKDMETAERFLGLLFRPDIKANLIGDLNPLSELELQLTDDDGSHRQCYLNFDFKRVVENSTVEHVLVTVNDVTKQVLLSAQLAEEKERSEQQMALLTSLLHTDPMLLSEFISQSFKRFDAINNILKDSAKSHVAFERKLSAMFVEVHSLKGDSSALGLDSFSDYSHRFEQSIKDLQSKSSISGNDFFALAVHLEELIRFTENIRTIADKLVDFSSAMKAKSETDDNAIRWQKFDSLAQKVADRCHKQVRVVHVATDTPELTQQQVLFINDVCTQFIRNAVVHGIETPSLREANGKPAIGTVKIELTASSDGSHNLTIGDDGGGFDYERIRQRALALGKWDAQTVASWNHSKLLTLIFEAGFSTQETVTEDAGQGVGMNVVKDRIKQIGGRIQVASKRGEYCRFTLHIPSARPQSAAA